MASWIGLGGPIALDSSPEADHVLCDPTLSACCQRDLEARRRGEALRSTLKRHDVTKTRERRCTVLQSPAFDGCRCCYDPAVDGGDYPALAALRSALCFDVSAGQEEEHQVALDEHDNHEETSQSGDEYDYLLDEELPSAREEKERMIELVKSAQLQQALRDNGYGVHRQVHPSRVLNAGGLNSEFHDPPPAVVLHLFDPDSELCACLDWYLEKLSAKTGGTKFVRSYGRAVLNTISVQRVLPNLNAETDLPLLMAIRDGHVVDICRNLCRFRGGERKLRDNALHEWLDRCGVLIEAAPILPERESSITQSEPVEESYYDCGVDACRKKFPHEHVGIVNEVQKGTLVAKDDVER